MAAGDDWRHTLPAFCALTNIDWLAVQIQYKYIAIQTSTDLWSSSFTPSGGPPPTSGCSQSSVATSLLPPVVSCPALRSPQDPWVICWSSSVWCLVCCFDLPDCDWGQQWERMEKISYEWINSWLPSESSVDHLVPKELSQQYLCIQKGLHE